MNLRTKNARLLALGVVSLMLSRLVFFLINDPEGPNLLIVTVLAVVIFFVILFVYRFITSMR
jgi:hypothetical protein